MNPDWYGIIGKKSPALVWKEIFENLNNIAVKVTSPVTLHDQTVLPDRLLSEAAWELWEEYQKYAPRTSQQLKEWTDAQSSCGKAVLILDAFSLRELPFLLGGAQSRNINITACTVTGAECPSTTDQFARALGLSSRASLANNGKPCSFTLMANSEVYTDVLNVPFEDCHIPPVKNLFVWHSWLDDLIHLHNKLPDQITSIANTVMNSDGFWSFVNKLRQGRKLIITADHGYAVSKRFSSEVENPDAIEILRKTFRASRCQPATETWNKQFMPPIVTTCNGYHVVTGQRKWRVRGGFPHVCHGGMSLLEVAVPWVEFDEF
ncbi:MAG TPA: hypothetical protein VKY57_16210 [Chitinispirillaceae bacterium]|nr:hypothetical protein [Chitinispirillaceae bacterium]